MKSAVLLFVVAATCGTAGATSPDVPVEFAGGAAIRVIGPNDVAGSMLASLQEVLPRGGVRIQADGAAVFIIVAAAKTPSGAELSVVLLTTTGATRSQVWAECPGAGARLAEALRESWFVGETFVVPVTGDRFREACEELLKHVQAAIARTSTARRAA